MSAISGDIHLVMMTVSRMAIVANPNSASIPSSLGRSSLLGGGHWRLMIGRS
jgi:hypothetical protein